MTDESDEALQRFYDHIANPLICDCGSRSREIIARIVAAAADSGCDLPHVRPWTREELGLVD